MGEQSGLDGTSWILTGWAEETELPESVQIAAEFGDGKVYGTSGINRYNSSVSIEGSALSFGPVMMTMMAGPEDAMQAERAFVGRLEGAASYVLDGVQLIVHDADAVASLTFSPAG